MGLSAFQRLDLQLFVQAQDQRGIGWIPRGAPASHFVTRRTVQSIVFVVPGWNQARPNLGTTLAFSLARAGMGIVPGFSTCRWRAVAFGARAKFSLGIKADRDSATTTDAKNII